MTAKDCMVGPTSIATVALILGCAGAGGGARFRIMNSGSSDCSTFTDVCARMTCSVSNDGTEAGVARITFSLFDPNGSVARAEEVAELGPGEARSVSHDFKEARFTLGQTKMECAVK